MKKMFASSASFCMFMLTVCLPVFAHIFKCSLTGACDHAFVGVFACISACVARSISMEMKCSSSHKFTHSPCFDSIQSTVCIITLVPCGNLLGPKYCSLTNPSFVFRRYTKHQSCFSTHAAHQPPLFLFFSFFYTHTHHPTTQALCHFPETQSSKEPKAGWLEQQDMLGFGFFINIFHFQMAPPMLWKDTTSGRQGGDPYWREGQKRGKTLRLNQLLLSAKTKH